VSTVGWNETAIVGSFVLFQFYLTMCNGLYIRALNSTITETVTKTVRIKHNEHITFCKFADISSVVVAVAVHEFSVRVGFDHETADIVIRFTRVIVAIGRRTPVQPVGHSVCRRCLLVKSNVVFVARTWRPVRNVTLCHEVTHSAINTLSV